MVEERTCSPGQQHALAIPALGAGGERVFGAAVAGNLRLAAPYVGWAVIDGCDHYLSEERPGELADLLLRFLDRRLRS